MKRYALPLSIGAIILVLLALIFVSSPKTPTYISGNASEPSISEEWVRGNPSSTVKLIEYSDFQCPACRAYFGLVQQLESEFGDKVAFIYRHYPLYQIHANADQAARAAEAAGKQGKFWEMHDKLFNEQTAWSALLDPTNALVGYAKDLGLDVEQFKADMNSDAVRQLVADDYQRGQRLGLNSTPSFVLNGVKIDSPKSLDEFRAVLRTAIGQ